jgi:hypothetical protein
MPIREQHHGGVAVAIAIGPGGFHQLLQLGGGQILARPRIGVRPTARGTYANCPIKGAGVTSAKCGFAMES